MAEKTDYQKQFLYLAICSTTLIMGLAMEYQIKNQVVHIIQGVSFIGVFFSILSIIRKSINSL